MNDAEICEQTTKWRHILQMRSYCYCDVSFIHSMFQSRDIHRPFSTWRFWVYYDVQISFEFVKRPVESSLRVCSML